MTNDDLLLKDYFIAEFRTIREELLDRLSLRTQYELIAYTFFMGLFGITFYVGYPILILILVQIFLAPLIFMIKELVNSANKLGSYLAARACARIFRVKNILSDEVF